MSFTPYGKTVMSGSVGPPRFRAVSKRGFPYQKQRMNGDYVWICYKKKYKMHRHVSDEPVRTHSNTSRIRVCACNECVTCIFFMQKLN